MAAGQVKRVRRVLEAYRACLVRADGSSAVRVFCCHVEQRTSSVGRPPRRRGAEPEVDEAAPSLAGGGPIENGRPGRLLQAADKSSGVTSGFRVKSAWAAAPRSYRGGRGMSWPGTLKAGVTTAAETLPAAAAAGCTGCCAGLAEQGCLLRAVDF
ncbi:hypothetical protein THAOC_17419, partial [Thalassiosira oceanica]